MSAQFVYITIYACYAEIVYQKLAESKIRLIVQGKRTNVPSVAILITDGPSSTSSLSTVAEATTAHQIGIKIYTIGEDSFSINRTELQLIASPPRLYYHQWVIVVNLDADLSAAEPLIVPTLCRPEYGKSNCF